MLSFVAPKTVGFKKEIPSIEEQIPISKTLSDKS